MANETITKGLIADSDINYGNSTFSRVNSAGVSTTYNQVRRTPDCINVRDPAYGATGDGSTDDTDAIIAATNAAYVKDIDVVGDYASRKALVYFPPGEYLISSQVRVPANVRWQGHGRGTTIIRISGS
jgi:hypothetical protein